EIEEANLQHEPSPMVQPKIDSELVPNFLPILSPRANKQRVDNTPQRTRLSINKRPDESVKEWAIRLADRLDKVTHTKQNQNWLCRRGENLKSCIENSFQSILRSDSEVWQERKRIGGYTIESEDKNGGIVTYICPNLDELNEAKDNIRKITPHL